MPWLVMILFAIALFFLFIEKYWKLILVSIAAFIVFSILKALIERDEENDIQYAEIVNRTDVLDTKAVPSGFSIGSNGNVRGYWKYKNVVDHTKVEFRVYYTDGSIKMLCADEGSRRYNKLMEYVGTKPKTTNYSKSSSGFAEQRKALAPPKIEKFPEEERRKTQVDRKKSKYYLEIPFEIAPNEYGLTISYPSCQVEHTKDGERRAYVRFTATYDPTVKGLRNRVIICSLVNRGGKTMDVRRGTKVFDTSGSQMIDLSFWKLFDEEPARVVVGVDRYN